MKFALAVSLLLSQGSGISAFSAVGRGGRARPAFLTGAIDHGKTTIRRTTTTTTTTTTKATSSSSCYSSSSSSSALRGILDEINSDAFDLSGGSSESRTEVKMNDAYEMFLAELVFSTNNPKVDIVENLDRASDPAFMEWLNQKIEKSTDTEERVGLRDLFEMIEEVLNAVEVSKLAEERAAKEAEEEENKRLTEAEAEAEAGRKMSNTDVIRRAAAIDAAASTAESETEDEAKQSSFYEEEITPEIRLSYEKLLKKLLPPYKRNQTPAGIVSTYYDQFDAQLVKVLDERVINGDADAERLLSALADEQQTRLAAATDVLREIVSLGDPMKMEGAIVKLARDGKIDEPLLLLLEANATQARDAGALPAAELMEKLRKRASDEKDKLASSKEIRLIRKLLRTQDEKEREQLLEDAFTPKESLLVPGTAANAQKAMEGEQPDQATPMPEVPPPDFINSCKAVLLNFGNLASDDDRGDLASQIKRIATEAEAVATRIYGPEMTLRDQQDRMWDDQTTSIFDLERMEIEAEQQGEAAPWTNPNAPDDYIPGFDSEGRMQIGGG